MFKMINHYYKFAVERAKISLKNSMEFKLDFILSIFAEIVYIAITFLFASIFTKAVPSLGLNAVQLFIYTQTLDIIYEFQHATRVQLVNTIKNGELNLYLIRPIHILYQIFWNNFGTKTSIIYIIKIIGLIVYISLTSQINLFIYTFIILATIIISLLMWTGFTYLVKSYDLKTIEAGTFLHRITNETNIGNYIKTYPIYLLPKFIFIYSAFFSFYYAANITLNIINGSNIWLILALLTCELFLAIIFLFAANLAWKKMLKYYEGFGG